MNYKEIPKAELHCHLEGCFRPETVMEIGNTLGMDIPQDPTVFREEWLLSKPLENLEVALKRFVDIQKVWCSEEVIERLTFEACEDAVEQGIRIMEFRYAPDFIAFDKPHLSFERIHAAILRGLERGAHAELAVGLIGIVQKTLSLKDAARTIDFIVENADTFVALDFLVDKARGAGLHLTTHAGEDPGPGSPNEVREAIEVLQAERIGHGIHIIHDDDVMALVRANDVALEVCPTSNWLTSAVPTTAEHPIRRLMEKEIAVTINSDDPGLFGIDLCHEYEILHREQGYTAEEFDRCNDIAATHSFLPLTERRRVWPRRIGGV
jgi:adenosine deaminase